MNKTEENNIWLFTFKRSHPLGTKYIKLTGSYSAARRQMFRMFGNDWAFQYKEDAESELQAQGSTEHKFFDTGRYNGGE